MKFRHGAAAAVAAAAGANAQAPPAYTPPASSSSAAAPIISAPPAYSSIPGVTYTTVTFDDCSSASLETMITVTNGITVTYCPECEHSGTALPSKTPGHVTTYTTTYLSLCPTGTVPVTYTVTESCDEPEPTWTPGPSHIPQGYTVTVKDCTVCHSDLSKTSTIPVTITEPCGCDANEGTTFVPTKKPAPATAKPTGEPAKPTGKPVQQISDGQIQNPTGGKPEASHPDATGPAPTAAPSKPDATGPAPTGPAATHPSGTTAGPVAPESSAPGDYGNTSHVTPAPYEGSASNVGVATFFSVVLGAAALAFGL